jgi:type IV pilus assembly protein PilB
MPYGLVLVTGPTGSGKTSTLYSFLNELNKPDRNIITVEDPVEFMLEGINQVQVNSKAGLNFAAGLRSILRQDPDIIMVGEIRDEETAEMAVRSAITGHLVLSTLHTNDAPGAVTRLVDMGVQPYLAADALSAAMAQRLVRRLCPSCKRPYTAAAYEQRILGLDEPVELYQAVGCPSCNNTGYKGRLAVHEVMMIDNSIRLLIEKGVSSDLIREQAKKNGMSELYDNCRDVVLKGQTTIQELVKTVYARS